jgi:CheY-like chemotaxis protein
MTEQKHPAADILIVDSNEIDTALMQEAISESLAINSVNILQDTAEVILFLNKKDKYTNAHAPDFIIIDTGAHELLKIIKGDPRFRSIPAIVFCASDNQADIAESYRLGANCYILKPANPIKFKKMISVINDFWLGIVRLPPNN